MVDFTSNIGEAIEYKRPNARKIPREFEIREGLEDKYKSIKELGLVFTAENLGAGMISMTLSDEGVGDFMIEVMPIPVNCNKVFSGFIERFDEEKYKKWRDTQC